MEELDRIIQQIDSGGITIQLRPEAGTRKIERFDQLKSFVEEEHAFWTQFKTSRLVHLAQSIVQARKEITRFESSFQAGQTKLVNDSITSIKNILQTQVQCFSSTALASFFREMYDINTNFADAAYDYFIAQKTVPAKFSSKEYIIGLFKCFIYENVHTSFTDKVKTETISLEGIRARYSETIDSIESYYHSTVERKDNELAEFKNELSTWKDSTVQDLQTKLEKTEKSFQGLTQQYEEYMRLEGPAKYWDKLHEDYEEKGGQWRDWAIGASLVATGILMCILYNFPECLYMQGQSFSFTSLKGTIVLALIVSILVYLIRLFVKLSISSYHLSRDAKERYQLTHVYLSMIKDAAVDEKDRAIVLQSLFSRADTGLLKGDHSPAMPEGLVSQVIRGVR